MMAPIPLRCLLATVLLTAAYGQVRPTPESAVTPATKLKYSLKGEFLGKDGAPVRSVVLGIRPNAPSEVGFQVDGDANGRVAALLDPGLYFLTIEAAGCNNVSRTLTLSGDFDLGRVVLDTDPNIVYSSSICCLFDLGDKPPGPTTLPATPTVLRGQIQPFSVFQGRRLTVQISCSVQLPGQPQRPPMDVARASVDSDGSFTAAVPACADETLSHRELRFSLKEEDGATLALLLPKMTVQGYYQSRFGIWLPVKPFLEETLQHATFAPELLDNRPLEATISVSGPSFPAGNSIFLNARLTNTSQEVLSIQSLDFVSGYDWLISDEHGNQVPLHLFRDRTGESEDRKMPRSHFLFPGESETDSVNISLLFSFASPGTYHVLARRVVRRPEVLGEQQISSSEYTFVIAGK